MKRIIKLLEVILHKKHDWKFFRSKHVEGTDKDHLTPSENKMKEMLGNMTGI